LCAQRIPSAIRERGQFSVTDFARFADNGDALRMQPGRRIQKMSRDIERFREFPVHQFFGRSHAEPSVRTDVFVPNLGVVRNIFRKHLNTFFGMEVDDFGAVLAQPIDAAAKIYGLADDNGANAKLADQAAAIPARASVVTMILSR